MTNVHLLQDFPVQQRVLLGRHDKVVRLVLVVDNVLEGDSQVFVERVEKVLLVDEGDAADLLHDRLGRRVRIDKVGRDGDRQLAAKLSPLETCFDISCHIMAYRVQAKDDES